MLNQMKFTDGQWLLQPNVAAHYATETYDIRTLGDQLVVVVVDLVPLPIPFSLLLLHVRRVREGAFLW